MPLQMIYKLAASLVAPPQPGTDPALLALLPAVRGLLSGTGVQMWAAKQLLDAAHMVEKAAASELGIAAAADDAGSDSFLGLPLAARTSPAVLAEPKDAAGPSGSGQLQRPRMEHATVALHLSTTAASALWQVGIWYGRGGMLPAGSAGLPAGWRVSTQPASR